MIKPTQLAASTIAFIFLCGIADLYPGPCLFMQPTDDMVRDFSKDRLAPAIKLIPSLAEKIKEPKSRDSGNTILKKKFPGGSWILTGANAGASFRSKSIKFLILDDFDGFDEDIQGEGSPEELADRRTGSFPGRKIYINSTPTKEGGSNIVKSFEKTSQGYFNVPCPHCGYYQYLIWGEKDIAGGIKFERDKNNIVIDAWYQCESCKKRIDEHEKPRMLEKGKYVHKYPERAARGFRYNALVTPLGWVNSWKYIAQKFIEAAAELKAGKYETYKTWINTLMAEPWEQKGDRKADEIRILSDTRPRGLVPSEGVLGLTAGVDTHDDGFYYAVRAWGVGMESWMIQYGFEDNFLLLEKLLSDGRFRDVNGKEYIINCILQDAMGHRTREVYELLFLKDGWWYPTKGEQRMNSMYSFTTLDTYPGSNKPIPGGIKLMRVNTTLYKNHLSNKIKIASGDPGAFHLHSDISQDYVSHMTSEFINDKGVWECPASKHNEYWDCEVLAYCAADYLGIQHWNPIEEKKEAAPKKKVKVKKNRRW